MVKNGQTFFSAQQIQFHLWPAYSPDMSPFEHVWDFVGWRIARDVLPAADTDEFCGQLSNLKYSFSGSVRF